MNACVKAGTARSTPRADGMDVRVDDASKDNFLEDEADRKVEQQGLHADADVRCEGLVKSDRFRGECNGENHHAECSGGRQAEKEEANGRPLEVPQAKGRAE